MFEAGLYVKFRKSAYSRYPSSIHVYVGSIDATKRFRESVAM